MAIEPAAISASPAVTTIAVDAAAPVSPAASANGTVSPSDIPITMSRTAAVAVKCFSTCSTAGILDSFSLWRSRYGGGRSPEIFIRHAPVYAQTRIIMAQERIIRRTIYDYHFWTRSSPPDDLHVAASPIRLRRS